MMMKYAIVVFLFYSNSFPALHLRTGKVKFNVTDNVTHANLDACLVEEQDNGNVYRSITTTNSNGVAVVERKAGVYYYQFSKDLYRTVTDVQVTIENDRTLTEPIGMTSVENLKASFQKLSSGLNQGNKAIDSLARLFCEISFIYERDDTSKLKEFKAEILPQIKKLHIDTTLCAVLPSHKGT